MDSDINAGKGDGKNERSKAESLMKEVGEASNSVEKTLKNLISKFQEGQYSTDKGISLLDLKCHMLLSYLANLTFVILKKCHGERIETGDVVLRLVELRTVLEKTRPIEAKLKYHIDKLLKYIPGNVNENDPLRFRANPDNLVCQVVPDCDEKEEDGDKKKEKRDVYEPPKLIPMHYADDVNDRKTRLLEQAKKRALSSSIMQELRDEYYDGPEEVQESFNSHRKKIDAETRRRIEYEEDHFVRLSMSAKEKHEAKKRRTLTGLNDLTHFGDIRSLSKEHHFQDEDSLRNVNNKRKSFKGKKKYKKKGFKKRK